MQHQSKHIHDRHRLHHGLTAQPFEEEPLKAHRFRQYVSYLKRGKDIILNILIISFVIYQVFHLFNLQK